MCEGTVYSAVSAHAQILYISGVFSSVTFREGWKHKSETRSTQTVFFPKDTF